MRPLSRLWLIQVSGISAQDYLARSDKTPVHSIITVSRDSGTLIVGCRRRVLVASSINFYLKNHHKFLQFHRHHVLTLPTLTCIEYFPLTNPQANTMYSKPKDYLIINGS